jgi:hypothetical protein
MQPGVFDVTKTIVSMPAFAGSGLSGEYAMSVRDEAVLKLQTFDQYRNPVLLERDWPYLQTSVAQLPQQGNMTWTS